jgi:FemAB-related protein (PEP-CTERM system-associated)
MDVCHLGDDIAPWDDYVMRNPLACNYHRVGWKAVIEQGFGHTTRYLCAKNGDRIVGILPLVVMKSLLFGRCVVSLPFFNYGGILADDNEAAEALLVSAQAVAREERASHIEFRHRAPHGQGLAAKQHKVTMILELSSNVESQWQRFDPKLRNQVRKAEKSWLWVQVGGRELLKDFYEVFARNMRDLGTPVYGLPFFNAIVTNSQSSSVIFIVRLGEQPVAVGLASTFKDTVEMPWAASLREHRNLCGNMLLYWEAIRFGIRHGFKEFDFGRSTPGEGTYRFKEQWGARPVPLAWEYWIAGAGKLPDMSPKNPKYKLPIRIWKRLPVPIATWLGPSIVRNIP